MILMLIIATIHLVFGLYSLDTILLAGIFEVLLEIKQKKLSRLPVIH